MTDNYRYENDLRGVSVVESKKKRKKFLRFPYRHYKEDTYWVPPLLLEQKQLIDTRKNPFFNNADITLFLAEKNGQTAGRIAAIEDRRFNEYHQTEAGFFGFFECIDDPSMAKLLFKAAEDWLKDRGLKTMIGPANPSMMDEVGILIEGFEEYPSILMPYHKPYYKELLEECGLQKEMDMLAFRVNQDTIDYKRLKKAESIVHRRIPSLNLRTINLKNLDQEIDIIREIFNEAWSDNWGFIPLTEEEFEALAKDLKTIVDEDIVFIAEIDASPVGFSISLPDYNQALRHMNGRLFPTGIFKLLYYQRHINQVRTALMGIKPEYQGKGIDALFHLKTTEAGREKNYYSSELSWVLETNEKMIRVAERIGASREKTYRMFKKQLL